MKNVLRLLVLAAALSPVGCKSKLNIPGTEIPDTPDSRAVIETIERVRVSFVGKDAAAVLSAAHQTYFDAGGTEDPSDDVGYDQLAPLLRRRLSQVDAVRYTIDYLELHVKGDRAVCRVWLDLSFRLKPLLDTKGVARTSPRYSKVQDYAEFELLREGDLWLVTRGL